MLFILMNLFECYAGQDVVKETERFTLTIKEDLKYKIQQISIKLEQRSIVLNRYLVNLRKEQSTPNKDQDRIRIISDLINTEKEEIKNLENKKHSLQDQLRKFHSP